MSFWSDLKSRKLVQWTLAYLAGAWLMMQLVDVLADRWPVPLGLQRGVDVVLLVGLFVAVVLAWYHGEQGRQRVSGPELLIIAALLAVGGGVVALLGPRELADEEEGASWPFGTASSVADDRPVLAVLPFANQSPAEDDAYFTDGMHQDVLTHLSKVGDLTVLALPAVDDYRDTDLSVAEIAAALGATAVLVGSVWRAGDQVRIDTQLIDPTTDRNLWVETYTRRLEAENVFAVQTEVAQRVAQALEVTLSPEEEQRIAMRPTESLAAYDLYLKGREAYQRYEDEENDEAIRLYRSALDLDSEYALAWAGLADAFAQRVCCFGHPLAWADSAVQYARRAVELEPELAEAHKALGLAYTVQERRRAALDANLRAVELDPNHIGAVNNTGSEHLLLGQIDEAIPWFRRAVRLAPNHLFPRVYLVNTYTALMMEQEATDWLESVLDLEPQRREGQILWAEQALAGGDVDGGLRKAEEVVRETPDDPMAWIGAAEVAYMAGDFERAVAWSQESVRLSPENALRNSKYGNETLLGLSLVASGDSAGGRDVLRTAMEDYAQRIEEGAEHAQFRWVVAAAHAVLGEEEEALEWLERAYEAGFRSIRLAQNTPALDGLRDDPRFDEWMARLEADVAAMRERVIQEERAAGLR